MLKVGILGGGQLGRMLLQSAANYPVETYVLENDLYAPAIIPAQANLMYAGEEGCFGFKVF